MNYDEIIIVEFFESTPPLRKPFRIVIRSSDGKVSEDLGFYETIGRATQVAVRNRGYRKVWQTDAVKALIPKETSK